jgi:hypothetical protein
MNAAISSQIISSEYFTNFYFSYYKTITFICIFSLARKKGNVYYHRKKKLKKHILIARKQFKTANSTRPRDQNKTLYKIGWSLLFKFFKPDVFGNKSASAQWFFLPETCFEITHILK